MIDHLTIYPSELEQLPDVVSLLCQSQGMDGTCDKIDLWRQDMMVDDEVYREDVLLVRVSNMGFHYFTPIFGK